MEIQIQRYVNLDLSHNDRINILRYRPACQAARNSGEARCRLFLASRTRMRRALW